MQSPEGSDESWSPGQRPAASWGQECEPCLAVLGEAHQGPPYPHCGAPSQTTNSTIFTYITPQLITLVSTIKGS